MLALLIENKKFKFSLFIQTILIDFSTKLFPKNKQTFHLLETILKNLDIDSIENGIKIIEDCLQWILSSSGIVQESLKNNESQKLLTNDISEMIVICILAGHGELKKESQYLTKCENISKYEQFINTLRGNLSYCSLDSLLLTKINLLNESTASHTDFSLPLELRSVMDENLLLSAVKLLKLHGDIPPDIEIGLLLSNIETVLEILNTFISYGALNDDLFNKSFWLKLLNMKLQMIEVKLKI